MRRWHRPNVLLTPAHILCRLPRKVSNFYSLPRCNTYGGHRVLLATIKYLGRNPCPRCLIKKEDLAGVGTHTDIVTRNHHRTDNDTRRQNVERARRHIFTEGLGVKSSAVEKIFKKHSNVPTRVSIVPLSIFNRVTSFTECILGQIEVGRTRLPRALRRRFAPRGGNRDLEVIVHTPSQDTACVPRRGASYSRA